MTDETNYKNRRRLRIERRRGQRGRGGFAVGLFVAAMVLFSVGWVLVDRYLPNFEVVPLRQFYTDMKPETIYTVLADERLSRNKDAILRDNALYIPVDFVKDYIDDYIFWDESVGRLTITTENKVIQMRTQELAYYINDRPFDLQIPVHEIDGVAYIPAGLLMDLYDVSIRYEETYRLVIVDDTAKTRQTAAVTNEQGADIRYAPDIKSPIAEKAAPGIALTTYTTAEAFTKVRTESGVVGYVKTNDITATASIPPVVKTDTKDDTPPKKPVTGKINLLWDQLTTVEASANAERRFTHPGLNVISPTWFSFDERLNGDIVNIADRDYVTWAHENDLQVWALITDNFRSEVGHAVLSDTTVREKVVKQLLAFVSIYDLDGINIDFENIAEEDAAYYIQFLRELYPRLVQEGVTLSVDLTVPKPFNLFYNRTEVAKACDYVVIMGYDEHYATSPVSGSVASIGFVAEGVAETLKEVPKEKIVLGMPYYVRVWRETQNENGETAVTSKAYTMNDAKALFDANGAVFQWLETTANDYADFTTEEDGETVTYRVWIENERSLEEKLKVMAEYDIAGVAGWSSAWLQDDIKDRVLDLVAAYLN